MSPEPTLLPPIAQIVDLTPRTLSTGAAAAPQGGIAYWIALALVVGGLCIIAIVVISAWSRGKRELAAISPPEADSDSLQSPASSSSATFNLSPSSSSTLQEAERLLRLMGEADDLHARLSAKLEDQSRKLEQLIAKAERLAAQQLQPQPTFSDLAATAPIPAPVPAPVPAADSTPIIVTRGSSASDALLVGARVPSASTPVRKEAAPAAAPAIARSAAPSNNSAVSSASHDAGGLEPLARQIYALSDHGFAPVDIARRLDQHVGKVELILALRTS